MKRQSAFWAIVRYRPGAGGGNRPPIANARRVGEACEPSADGHRARDGVHSAAPIWAH